jgi:hypothetical protein
MDKITALILLTRETGCIAIDARAILERAEREAAVWLSAGERIVCAWYSPELSAWRYRVSPMPVVAPLPVLTAA